MRHESGGASSDGGKPAAALDVRFLKLNLEDLSSVKAAARWFTEREGRLDMLINNAGVMNAPYRLTGDGLESQWQVNYLAPHLLTVSLLPLMLATAAAAGTRDRVRIVNVVSNAAFFGPKTIQFDDVNMTDAKGMMVLWQRYGHSKQASIRDAKEINDRYGAQGEFFFSFSFRFSFPDWLGDRLPACLLLRVCCILESAY